MAIRFADKTAGTRKDRAPTEPSRADGEARFATPIEAEAPVNPEAGGELPFATLPRAEKAARKKRVPKEAR